MESKLLVIVKLSQIDSTCFKIIQTKRVRSRLKLVKMIQIVSNRVKVTMGQIVSKRLKMNHTESN